MRKDNNAKRIAELESELATPHFPKELAYIWRAYFRLRRRMDVGFNGPNPIGWQDIDAFVRRSGLRLVPWEIVLIEAIDDVYLGAMLSNKRAPTPEKGPVATVPISDGHGVKSLLRSIGRRRGDNKKGGRSNG